MISFRFHLVSLVAVFLALGLGILTGTTVINRGLVAQLEQQTVEIARESDQLREDVEALRTDVDRAADFAEETTPYLLDGQLAQRDVVLVTEEGTDPNAVNGVQGALADARADIVALLQLDESLAALTDGQRSDLADRIGVDAGEDPETFGETIAVALAERLAFGVGDGEADTLATLLEEGLLANTGPPLDDTGLGQLSSDVVVVVGGGDGEEPSPVLVPLVEALAEAGTMVGAAEPLDSTEPFVEALRAGAAADGIVTQDNVDELAGQIGLVLALDDLISRSRPGHYGVKDGATSVIPPPA